MSDAQLASSGGLVRCGHCQAVFDATANLVDPETGESRAKSDPQYGPRAWDLWAPQQTANANSVLGHDAKSVSRGPFIVPGALKPELEETDHLPASSAHAESLVPDRDETPQAEPAPAPEPRPPAAPAVAAANGVNPVSSPSLAAEHELHALREPVPSPAAPDERRKPESAAHTDNREPRFAAPAESETPARANAHADFASSDARSAEPTLPENAEPSSGAWRADSAEPRFHDGSLPELREHPAAGGARPFEVTREARPSAPRRTFWRVIGGLFALALAVLLVAQLAWWRRETVMVYWPESQGLFEQVCTRLGCQVSPPRDIDGLQVEASDLRQIDGPHRLELRVPLRNRYNIGLAYPAIELTLFDSKNEVAIRRVLWPQDYVQPGTPIAAGLPAHTTQTMVVRLDTGGAVATNFRVQIFYP